MQPHHSKSTNLLYSSIYLYMFIHIPFLTKMLAMSIMENELSKRVIVFQFNKNPTFIYIVAMCIVQKTHQVTPNHLSFHYFFLLAHTMELQSTRSSHGCRHPFSLTTLSCNLIFLSKIVVYVFLEFAIFFYFIFFLVGEGKVRS